MLQKEQFRQSVWRCYTAHRQGKFSLVPTPQGTHENRDRSCQGLQIGTSCYASHDSCRALQKVPYFISSTRRCKQQKRPFIFQPQSFHFLHALLEAIHILPYILTTTSKFEHGCILLALVASRLRSATTHLTHRHTPTPIPPLQIFHLGLYSRFFEDP